MSASSTPQESNFGISRIYLKDVSFESPNSIEMFQQDWNPSVNLELDVNSQGLNPEGDVVEVSLKVSVTTKIKDKTAFLVEVTQAGIFSIPTNLTGAKLAHCIGSYCPNILLPYARETICDLVSKGSYPQLNLSPVDFDSLLENHMREHEQHNKQVVLDA